MIETTIELRVRYAETDQMAVVYHGNYFPWFELARVHLLDDLGLPYRVLEARGFMLPVLCCQAEFKQPARFDDRLQIIARIQEPPKVRFSVHYEVSRAATLLAIGQTSHAFMTAQGRASKPPADFLEKMHAHF